MQDKLKRVGVLALLAAATLALIEVGQLAHAMRAVVLELPVAIPAVITTESRQWQELVVVEAEATRKMALAESGRYRQVFAKELAAARDMAAAESGAWRNATQAEVALARSALVEEARAAVSLADQRAAVVTGSVERTLAAYSAVPAAIGDELAPYWRCKGNGACWPAQFTALLGAARVTAGRTSTTMRSIDQSIPPILSHIDQTAGNIARITRPPTLIERVLRLGATAAGGAVLGAMK